LRGHGAGGDAAGFLFLGPSLFCFDVACFGHGGKCGAKDAGRKGGRVA
jgi:hypothetical protein